MKRLILLAVAAFAASIALMVPASSAAPGAPSFCQFLGYVPGSADYGQCMKMAQEYAYAINYQGNLPDATIPVRVCKGFQTLGNTVPFGRCIYYLTH